MYKFIFFQLFKLQEALAASDRLLDSAKNILGEDPKVQFMLFTV